MSVLVLEKSHFHMSLAIIRVPESVSDHGMILTYTSQPHAFIMIMAVPAQINMYTFVLFCIYAEIDSFKKVPF